jgi:hypothetical protein
MASADLTFALELADLADSLSLPRFRALDLRIETKYWDALTHGGPAPMMGAGIGDLRKMFLNWAD